MKKIFSPSPLWRTFLVALHTPRKCERFGDYDSKKNCSHEKGIAGLGIGESQDQQMAMDEAALNARADVSNFLESKMGSMEKSYKEEVGEDLTEHMEVVRKNVSSNLVKGATLAEVQVETSEGVYKVYGIMVVNPKLVLESMEAELNAKQADVARFRASKAYQEANEEFKAYEAYKNNLNK
jgi:hypothetical protein